MKNWNGIDLETEDPITDEEQLENASAFMLEGHDYEPKPWRQALMLRIAATLYNRKQ